jgi:tyrosyl-tRNA synthetase
MLVLKKLRDFQRCGHRVVFIVGDFTALIGDPTGRNKTRPPLTIEEVDANARTYVNQVAKILDPNNIDVRHNRTWFGKIDLHRVITILSKLTVAQIMQRNDFAERLENKVPIAMHELLYPVMQAVDSLEINADVELGGTDQLFNNLIGRGLQEAFGMAGQVVICMPILTGTDGTEKMSKSKGNYIGLTDDPNNMYGKIMSIPDKLIKEYLELATEIDAADQRRMLQEIEEARTNPMLVKKAIAFDIVRQYHGEDLAKIAETHFYRQIQTRDLESKEYEEITIPALGIKNQTTLLDLVSRIHNNETKSATRRLIAGGGVSVNSKKIIDPLHELLFPNEGIYLKVGKRSLYYVKS